MARRAGEPPDEGQAEGLATAFDLERALWDHFEADRLGDQSEWVRPRSREQLGALLRLCYRASLRHAETRPVRFQVCYDEMVPPLTARFAEPVPLSVDHLVSLSPAVGARRRWLAVCPRSESDETLQAVGLIDPLLSPSPTVASVLNRWGGGMNLSETSGLAVAVLAPGWMRVSTSAQRLFELGEGRLMNAYTVHQIPQVQAWYEDLASLAEDRARTVALALLRRTWASVLTQVRDTRHGGTFLILPDAVTAQRMPIRLAWPVVEDCVRESLRQRLAVEPELSRQVRGRTDLPSDVLDDAHFLERDLGRAERLLIAMSQIDGAVALRRDMSVIGFGGEILDVANQDPLASVSTIDLTRSKPALRRPIASFGMRHRSALRFCQAVPGAIAFVISQDGDVRVFVNEDGELRLHDGATPEDWILA